MKKLLLIAILMLALVITAVACTETPEEPGTSDAEVTTVETPTEAPSDEPDVPTEEPDTDPVTEPEETEPQETVPQETEPQETEPQEAEPQETETRDPMEPVNVFDAEDIKTVTGGDPNNMTQDCLTLEDGYVHVVPIGSDPYWYPFAGVDGARYVAIRYRTDATGADMQLYMASTGTGPQDDTTMIRQPVVADGEWQLVIFDTQSLIDAEKYDGKYVSYFRFDPLEAGYILNEDGEPYKNEDGTWARYSLPEGCFIDIAYIAFFHSEEAAKKYNFEQYKAPDWVGSGVVSHLSFDVLDTFSDGNKVAGVFTPGQSAGWDGVITLSDFSVDALRYWGWIAGTGDLGQFGYQINGGSAIYNDEWTHEEDMMAHAPAGSDHARRMQIMISLAGLSGENTIRVLYRNAAGKEACLTEFTVIAPAMDDHNFKLNAADTIGADNADVNLKDSNLAGVFEITYGQGDTVPSFVTMVNGSPAYRVHAFNAISVLPNGAYAFSLEDVTANPAGFSSMFVRAIRNASPEKQFFGQDGHDAAGSSHGGSGIYLSMDGEYALRINIKSYVDQAYVANIYSVDVESNDITVVDDGSIVYILSGDKLVATVAISGTADYGLEGVGADEACASATLSLCDGNIYEIPNALLAASCDVANSVGVATRGGGSISFTSIALQPFSSVEIPEMEIQVARENIALNKPVTSTSVENDTNLPEYATDGNESTRFGALPNGTFDLIVDLEAEYALSDMKVIFENASWNYTVSVSVDGEHYDEIYAGTSHGAKTMKILDLNGVAARYIKFTRLEDDGATHYWFSIFELYVYAVDAE